VRPELFKNRTFNDLLLLLTGGIVYLLSVYKFGLGVTDDSVNYLSAANTLPGHILKVDGTPFIEWPPLYPLILSLYKLTGISIVNFTAIVQGIVFVLNLIITGRLLQPVLRSRYIYFIAILSLLFSTPLLETHIFVWSEGIFILLLLLSLSVMVKYLETDRRIYFISFVLLSLLMCLQRKTGLFFTINFGIALMVFIKNKTFLKKSFYTILYMFIAMAPFMLWTFRRYKVSGRVFDLAFLKPDRIFSNLKDLGDVISSWVLPDEIPLSARMMIFIIAAVALSIYLARSPIVFRELFDPMLIKVCFILLAGYLILLPVVFIYIQGQKIDDRVLSPVYIIILMFVFLFTDRIISQKAETGILKRGILLVITLSLFYPAIRSIHYIKKLNDDGPGGYNSAYLRNSPMIQWLGMNETTRPIMTNNVYVLNYYLNYRSTLQREIVLPDKTGPAESFLLVSFNDSGRSDLKDYDFDYLTDGKYQYKKSQLVYKSNEGTVRLIEQK
jgi:hypothetical protein